MVSSFSLYCTNCGAANQAQAAFCFACGHSLQVPVASSITVSSATGFLVPAHLLKERYRMVEQLGRGGMGAVYKAEDTLFSNQLVAVKEMSQNGLNAQEILEVTEAFKREAHLLAGLNHPNLPRIHDHFSDAGRWYLVMDFIAGETLETYVSKAKGGYLPIKEALGIGIQLCTVLYYLHTRQPPIIFRDLKPGNVMRTPAGQLYLIDFGIARHFKPGQSKDTAAFGSAGYAAPEQYGKTQTTPRSDIYSLGATLHQLLSGDDPSQTPFQFAPLQLHGQPASAGLEAVIMRMLEMNADKRPASMLAVKQELQRLVTQQIALETRIVQAIPPQPPAPAAGGILVDYQSYARSLVPPQPTVTKPPTSAPQTPQTRSIATYRGHIGLHGVNAPVNAVVWSPDGKYIASAGDDATVQVWRAVHGELLYTYRGHIYKVTAVAWSPDGSYITSGGKDGKLQVYFALDGKHLYTYSGPHMITAVAWSPKSTRIAFGDSNGRIQVRDATDGAHAYTYQGHVGSITAMAWNPVRGTGIPDGQYIASSAEDQTVRVWDARSGSDLLTYRGHIYKVTAVSWSPDGQYIASGGAGSTVHLWNAIDGSQVVTYRGHTDTVTAVAWSPAGTHIVSGSADKTLQIWNAADGALISTYHGHTATVTAVAWSPDGARIASASVDGTVQVWGRERMS